MTFLLLFERYYLRRWQTPPLEPDSSREEVFAYDPRAIYIEGLFAAGSNQTATATLTALEGND
jgi:hypothetical protein